MFLEKLVDDCLPNDYTSAAMHPLPMSAQHRPTAIQVAKCLVKIAHEEQEQVLQTAADDPMKHFVQKQNIDHLKLQKVLYFAQAISLAVYDEPLFDEEIEAWPLGPVIPSVYQAFKQNGASWISKDQGAEDGIDSEKKEFLRQIWLEFGKYTALQLVEMTHKHDPWKNAKDRPGRVIDEEEMRNFYRPMLVPENAQETTAA